MQGFPSMNTIRHFTIPADLDTSSSAMRTHQKHPFGYPNIKLYIEKKFHAPKKFEDLVYVSQLMQADAIGTAIEAHRANMPFTMGTLFWQWNDCWPVVSWSAVDYFGNKKALYYETKREYAPYLLSIPVTDSPKLKLNFISDLDTTFEIEVEATAFDFSGRQRGRLVQPIVDMVERQGPLLIRIPKGFANPEDFKDCYWQFTVKSGKLILAQQVYLFLPPKELNLKKPLIRWKWLTGDKLELTTDKFAYGVFLDLPEGVEPDDNYFYLLPGEKKIIQFTGHLNAELLKKSLKIKSLVDTY